MPNLRIISAVQHDGRALTNLINYVARPDKCRCRLYGATNISLAAAEGGSMERALRDYNTALWKFHRKADGRYALHFIIGFAPSEARCLAPRKVLDLGYFVAMSAFPGQVCYFAVHDHSCYRSCPGQVYYHIDMMVLTVDIATGQLYGISRGGGYRILKDLADYMKKYVPEAEIGKPIVFFGRNEGSGKLAEMEL